MGLGFLPPQGSYFLLYMQRIALYSQVGLDLVYIKEIEHLFCAGLFSSSFASQRVRGKSINKDLALFSLCGRASGVGNPSMAGFAIFVGPRLPASVSWLVSGVGVMLGPWAPAVSGRTLGVLDPGADGENRLEEKTISGLCRNQLKS